jgi:hypothetical protein
MRTIEGQWHLASVATRDAKVNDLGPAWTPADAATIDASGERRRGQVAFVSASFLACSCFTRSSSLASLVLASVSG